MSAHKAMKLRVFWKNLKSKSGRLTKPGNRVVLRRILIP